MKKNYYNVIAVGSLIVLGLMSFCDKRPALAAEKTRLSIATAGTTGVVYLYGGAVASIASKYAPGLIVTAEATGGSVENMKMLGKKQADLATVPADVLYEAFYDFKNSKHFKDKVDVRTLFAMYSQPHHFVTLEKSNVNSMMDVKGKRVAVGSPGSGSEVKTKNMLEALGITYKDFTPEYLSFGEAAEALQDGTIAAAFLGVSYPAPALVNLAMTNPIRLVPFSDNEVATIVKTMPIFSKSVIPAKTYKGVDKDTQTICVQQVMICRADLPEDVAYRIVKTVFEHKKELDQIHSSFRETILENAVYTLVPVHPGAIKYFKEMNVLK
jgi:uncharacterized protein